MGCLARQVAAELSERDALAAHAELEHGISLSEPVRPSVVALSSGVAFAAGAAIPLLAIVVAPDPWRIPITFVAVVVALCVTSLVLARWGNVRPGRTVVRTVAVGVFVMGLTLGGGSLFNLS